VTSGRPVIIARSVHGLEWVCASEVSALAGAAALAPGDIELGRRQVTFSVPSVSPALLGLRTADDAFLQLGVVEGVGAAKDYLPALGRAAAALDWQFAVRALREVRHVPDDVAFDVVASLEGSRGYSRFAVERCAGSALSAALGWRFAERDAAGRAGPDPDLTVRVFVSGDRATVAVRLGRRPLHRREYKASTGPGTLHPPVAAGFAAIAAPWAGLLVDPFCGDGTIAIEAALARPGLRVVASDIDPVRAGNARLNASRAGVDIDVSVADAANLSSSSDHVDAIVTNPPWNLAVDLGGRLRRSGDLFWDALPAMLGPAGVLCCLVAADQEVAGRQWTVGLRQQLRLAGRVAVLLLAAPADASAPTLPAELARWRRRALDEGIVTETGF
jgi:23S rRNA G2445 N2-methylase RlmL